MEIAERLYEIAVSPSSFSHSDHRMAQPAGVKAVKDLEKVVKGERFWLDSIAGGQVEHVRREDVLTPDKHAVIVDVHFDCGMTATFSKICNSRIAELS